VFGDIKPVETSKRLSDVGQQNDCWCSRLSCTKLCFIVQTATILV